MIGLPDDETRVETGLKIIGLAGVVLGWVLMLLVVCFLVFSLFAKSNLSVALTAFPLFFVGATVVISDLCLAALGQGLATFRLMAHNSHKERSTS